MLSQPLELVTGLPGASKTLHTIFHVEQVRKKTGRPVFYAGIKGLTLPWEEIDPQKWMETPPGAIIVIDEAQQIFRPSSVNKDPQPWITELETIRHGGRNMVMVTQQPMLVHPNVRRLAGKHFHIVRMFGSNSATMHEFDGVRENCSKSAGRSDSIKHVLRFPKEVFAWYKSAEIHTVKRTIPMRLVLLGLLLVVIPIGAWYAWYRMHHVAPDVVAAKPGTTSTLAQGQARPGATPAKTQREWLTERTPRIAGLAMTAPVYDKIMEPKVAPMPTSCIASASRCSCYTQQGTKMPEVPKATCQSIVENGYFDDTREPVDRRGFFERQQQSGALVLARQEPSAIGADQEGPAPRLPIPERTRQTVTPSSGSLSNGGPATLPKRASS